MSLLVFKDWGPSVNTQLENQLEVPLSVTSLLTLLSLYFCHQLSSHIRWELNVGNELSRDQLSVRRNGVASFFHFKSKKVICQIESFVCI